MMQVKVIKSGSLLTNTYVVSKDNNCIIIDPAFAFEKISEYIDENNYNVLGILLTHGHFDHIEDSDALADKYKCKIYINKADLELLLSANLNCSLRFLKRPITLSKRHLAVFDHEIILKLDNFMIDVMFTPGHSKGGACYLIDNELFSGDTLYRNGVGRVDLYGGNSKELDESLKYLFSLDDNVVVFPGHGDETTIGKERHRYV